MNKGTLYLIPTSLGSNELVNTLPSRVMQVINYIDNYVVENVKSAVQFLKLAGIVKKVQDLSFSVLNVDTGNEMIPRLLQPALEGKNIGLLSEAGVPCVADPGAKLVAVAHESGIKVIPLVGPSSIILALMASGLNGQNFAFNGYLPIERKKRKIRLLELQKIILATGQTQIIIEAPHRNDNLMADIISSCAARIKLCMAVDLTMESESITTKTIANWKLDSRTIGKKPAIFLIGK